MRSSRPAPLDAKERRTSRYEKRFREAVDAAAAVFAEKGYEGASTKDIADLLNIRQGSVYYYFPSKEAALEEVCYWGVDDFVHNIETVAAADCSADEKLRCAVHSHLAPLEAIPDYVRVFLTLRRNLPRNSRVTLGRLTRRYEAIVESIIQEGAENGVFSRDLDCRQAALALIGLCNSVANWFGRIDHPPLPEIARQYSEILLTGFRTETR